MSDYSPNKIAVDLKPKPNPVTRRAHRRQVLRQIALPFALVIVLVAAVVVILVLSGVGDAERWAEISTIFIVLLTLIALLAPLALALGMIYLIAQLLRSLPIYTHQAQQAIERIKSQIRSGSDISVRPLLQIQSFLAMMDTLFGRNK